MVLGLERDQQSADQDLTTLRVLKNRYSGEVGVACSLQYDNNTCKYNETKNAVFNPSTDFWSGQIDKTKPSYQGS